MKTEWPRRHDAVEKLRQLVVVVISDVKIGERRAEDVVGISFGAEHRVHVDAVLVVKKRDDEREKVPVFQHHATDNVAAAIAEKARVEHFDRARSRCTSRCDRPVDALCDQCAILHAVLKGPRKSGDCENLGNRVGIDACRAGKSTIDVVPRPAHRFV